MHVARYVIKCVAVIEKVNYLKNCVCFDLCIHPVDTVETLDCTLLLSRQLFFQLIIISFFTYLPLRFKAPPEFYACA